MTDKFLTGEVVDPLVDHYEKELERIKGISQRISNDLHDCRDAFNKVKLERDALLQATAGLRKLLAPLWGELQNVPVDVTLTGIPAQPNTRIEAVKRSMPGKPAELIDLLLVHGPMSVTQIITIARWGKNSVYQTVSKLMKAGIVANNGGKYTLKEA